MRAREYIILDLAVGEGIRYGWQQAHKHNDSPSPDDIREAIRVAVLSSVGEYFTFDDETDGVSHEGAAE